MLGKKKGKMVNVLGATLAAVIVIGAPAALHQPAKPAAGLTVPVEPGEVEIPQPGTEQAEEFCAQQVAKQYLDKGVNTPSRLEGSKINGRVYVIMKEEIDKLEKERARARAASVRAARAAEAAKAPRAPRLSSSSNSTSTPEPAPAPSKQPNGSKAGLIRSIASSLGYGASDIEKLIWIANKESNCGTHPNTYKTGRTYIGIFQLGPHLGTVAQRVDDDYNIRRAIRYMVGRYGSISGAYNFWKKNGWY